MLVSYNQKNFVYLGKAYVGDSPDITIEGKSYSNGTGGVAIRADEPRETYRIEDIFVSRYRTGINVGSSSDAVVFDYEFRETANSGVFASAIVRDQTHTGQFYGQRIYADGKDIPLNKVSGGYNTTNTDFLTNNVNSGMAGAKSPMYFRDLTAENFSDAIFDSKSSVYIMNATIENAYRLIRAWDGANIYIINSELSTENGRSIAWLAKNTGKIFYYNSRFNGDSDLNPSLIDIDSVNAKDERPYISKQVIELSSNPLPAIDSFFSTSRSVFSVEISVNGGRWQNMAIPNGGRMDTFIGDPLFELPDLGRGTYDVRVYETTSSGVKRLLSEESVNVGSTSSTVSGSTSSDDGFRLYVVDADRDRFLFELRDGVSVDLATVQGRNLTLVADYAAPTGAEAKTKSVKLDFDDGNIVRIEASAPYALFGDKGDDLLGGLRLGTGTFSFSAVAYDSLGGKGVALAEVAGDFSVRGSTLRAASVATLAEEPVSVGTADPDLAIYAVDATSGRRIVEIGDDARLSRSLLGDAAVALVVEARSTGRLAGGFGSMALDYENGDITVVDNEGPFLVFGENSEGDLQARRLDDRYYDLDIWVYAGEDASGQLLKSYQLDFELV